MSENGEKWNRKIATTGQLRDFLAKTMIAVQSGNIDLEKASRITKLAGQVNESFYAEAKIARIRAEAGEQMPALGSLRIGQEDGNE